MSERILNEVGAEAAEHYASFMGAVARKHATQEVLNASFSDADVDNFYPPQLYSEAARQSRRDEHRWATSDNDAAAKHLDEVVNGVVVEGCDERVGGATNFAAENIADLIELATIEAYLAGKEIVGATVAVDASMPVAENVVVPSAAQQ